MSGAAAGPPQRSQAIRRTQRRPPEWRVSLKLLRENTPKTRYPCSAARHPGAKVGPPRILPFLRLREKSKQRAGGDRVTGLELELTERQLRRLRRWKQRRGRFVRSASLDHATPQ